MTVAIYYNGFGIGLKRGFWQPTGALADRCYFRQSPHSGDCNSTSPLN